MRKKLNLLHLYDNVTKAFGVDNNSMIEKLLDMKLISIDGKMPSLSMYAEKVWNNDKFSDEEVALLLITYVDLMKFNAKMVKDNMMKVIKDLKEGKL
jgi:hypothetical protein